MVTTGNTQFTPPAYENHDVYKAQKVAAAAVGLVAQNAVLPNLMTKQSIDQFKGALGDTLTYRVPGRLPYRRYAFRNDRSVGIKWDVYKEGKTSVTVGDHIYSGVRMTDEQYEFDFGSSWAPLLNAQADAVTTGVNNVAVAALADAPYQYTIGGAEANLRSAILEARKLLNKLRVPTEQRYLVVGSDFEQAMLEDKNLTLTSDVAQQRAESALADATLGRIAGFTVVLDMTIDPDAAYAIVGSGFVQVTGAPYVPNSVGFGSTQSYGGYSLRWMRDYDVNTMQDRSVLDTYCGAMHVLDQFIPASKLDNDTPVDPDELGKFFVRGIKMSLAGTSQYSSEADLVSETGIKPSDAWKAPATTAPAANV